MKYQSIIIESDSVDINKIKKILAEKFSIDLVKDININTISKLEEKESIGILEVSQLSEWAYKKNDEIRLLVIERAELLTDQAQNSLLKLVEEPPENILVILVTANPTSLLRTIISRCLFVKGETEALEFKYSAKDFIKANYLERVKIIDRMLSEDISRNLSAQFIEELLKVKLELKDVKNFDEIREIYKGLKRGVNLKLCFDYLNILLS